MSSGTGKGGSRMSEKKKENKSQLAKECLFTALTILMEKKNFEDITISELTEKAGVSRMTYYRTYTSKEDILLQYFEEKLHATTEFLKSHPDLTGYQFCLHFFRFFREHITIVESMYKAGLIKLMMKKFTEIIEVIYRHLKLSAVFEPNFYYSLALKAGGLLSVLMCWIENGLKESPEEMALMAAPLLDF